MDYKREKGLSLQHLRQCRQAAVSTEGAGNRRALCSVSLSGWMLRWLLAVGTPCDLHCPPISHSHTARERERERGEGWGGGGGGEEIQTGSCLFMQSVC